MWMWIEKVDAECSGTQNPQSKSGAEEDPSRCLLPGPDGRDSGAPPMLALSLSPMLVCDRASTTRRGTLGTEDPEFNVDF
jgi:hypothetical protein